MLPIYIINLPADSERFEAVRTQTEQRSNLELFKVEAVRGSLIPDAACRILTRNKWSVNHKGTLGCFLSHLRAWELLSNSSSMYGLVVEDDVELRDLERLSELKMPEDCDLLWCNDRTAYPSRDTTTFRPIFPALAYVEQHGRAIGGDCYALTPRGARSLLSFVESDSLFTHVDLRLMAYSITVAEGEALKGAGKISDNVSALRSCYAPHHKLTSHSLWPPISKHLTIPSRRAAEDELSDRIIL